MVYEIEVVDGEKKVNAFGYIPCNETELEGLIKYIEGKKDYAFEQFCKNPKDPYSEGYRKDITMYLNILYALDDARYSLKNNCKCGIYKVEKIY